MASSAPSLLRVAGPLARAAASATRSSTLLSAATAALRRLEAPTAAGQGQRHPMAPAALRVERARSRGNGTRAEQTAITVWFGQGPSLPGPGGDALRSAARIGGSVIGAAALAAMTVIAARREEQRKVIDAPTPAVPRT
jgi:hypothetical protein